MWLIYALGGGWGHLTRAVALARAARSHAVRILTNSEYADFVRQSTPELDIVALSPGLPVSEARRMVVREILQARPECLIVDTFPRGLVGELRDVASEKRILIHRHVNPRYAAAVRNYTEVRYPLILIPGQGEGTAFANLPQSVVTEPWFIREASELAANAGRSAVVCAGGRREEAEWYGEAAALIAESGQRVTCIAAELPRHCPPECWIRHWPAMDILRSAAVAVAGGGYNAVHECLALGVPLVARAWPRKYDEQDVRIRRAALRGRVTQVFTPGEAAVAALRVLQDGLSRATPCYANGARDAVRHIQDALTPAGE